jgi:hypothetical protein
MLYLVFIRLAGRPALLARSAGFPYVLPGQRVR